MMGFYSTQGATKQSIVAEILRERTKVLAHSVKGNTLWTVQEDNAGEAYIGCYRLQADRNYGWGYKPMDESMGPCYYDVPAKFLKLQPIARNEYSAEWRVKVAAYQADQARQKELVEQLAVGCKITLKPSYAGGVTLDVVKVKPLLARGRHTVFRVAPRMIASVEHQLTSL